MTRLTNKATGEDLGSITGDQLAFLQDQLVEESLEDRDYWLNRRQVEVLAENGGDPALITLLYKALGDGDDLEVAFHHGADAPTA